MRNQKVSGRVVAILAVAVGMVFAPALASAETVSAMPGNKGFATIKEILDNSCSGCHDWTGSYETITGNGHIVAGSPEKSILYQKIASDEMPQSGDKLTPDQKAFIKGWIMAGAPSTDLAISVPAADTGAGTAPASQGFLFFPSKVAFHEVTGFTSTALFLGAGVLGIVHFVEMMDAGHAYRDSYPGGFNEDNPTPQMLADRSAYITSLWSDPNNQALRWWHIGLIAGGESLYIGDALTGLSMLTKPSTDGKIRKNDIHRIAFFTHASLMAAQIVLGFFTTDAMNRGDHDTMIALGAAHAAIGLAIPVVMLGAGLENMFLPE